MNYTYMYITSVIPTFYGAKYSMTRFSFVSFIHKKNLLWYTSVEVYKISRNSAIHHVWEVDNRKQLVYLGEAENAWKVLYHWYTLN